MPFASIPSTMPLGRVLAVAGLCALVLGGCGRRGPLESPPTGAAPGAAAAGTSRTRAAAVGDAVATRPGRAAEGQTNAPGQAGVEDGGEAVDEPTVASPVPTPPRPSGRRRSYVVPKDPFILDPLL